MVTPVQIIDCVPLDGDGFNVDLIDATFAGTPLTLSPDTATVNISDLIYPPLIAVTAAVEYAAELSGQPVASVLFEIRCRLAPASA